MKRFLYLIAAMFVVIGCITKLDISVIDENRIDTPLSFCIYNDISSKALDITTSNLSSIEVTAFETGTTTSPDINAVTFTGSGSPKVFSCSPGILWPDYPLDFFVYSTGSAIGQVSKTGYNTFVITPSATPASQVDFVYACALNQSIETAVNGNVSLNFLHAESKVSVKVKNTSSSLKFQVFGWKLGYLDNSATFTHDGSSTTGQSSLSSSCWSDNDTPSISNTYIMDLSSSPVSVAASTSSEVALSGEMIVIPQNVAKAGGYSSTSKGALLNGSYVALKLKIMDASTDDIIYGGDSGEWAVFPVNFEFLPGDSYCYSINLGDVVNGAFYETNPVEDNIYLWGVMEALPLPINFAGLEIAPAPLYYNGSALVIKDDDWNHTSYNSKSGLSSGSYLFNYDQVYSVSGISYGGYSDWRMPTAGEFAALVSNSRNGATVNGTANCCYALIRLTGVSHASSSTPAGILLLPDNLEISGISKTFNWNTASTSGNTGVTAAQLNEYLNLGCVFLPASGRHYPSGGWSDRWKGGGTQGHYWSSTMGDIYGYGRALYFTTSSINAWELVIADSEYKAVRLVRTAD